MARQILVVEDDPDLSAILRVNIESMGYGVHIAATGDEGLEAASAGGLDLVILDLMLPGVSGLEILKRLRSGGSVVPILILTSKSSEMDRVIGLELGADDYVTKPFSVLELQARIKAIFRRQDLAAAPDSCKDDDSPGLVSAGPLIVDAERRVVRVNGDAVDLTAREFDLLYYFMTHPGRVFTRSQLLDAVWGYGHSGYEHTVNSHINRLRGKIEPDPDNPAFILTVWGVGYKFVDDEGA